MKINIFLGLTLFIQGFAFLFMGESEELKQSSQMVSALLTPELSLGDSTDGTTLQKWLDKQGVKVEESASRYEVDTEQVKSALKMAKVDPNLRKKLELSASINALSAVSISEINAETTVSTELLLNLAGEQWQISSAYDYPADQLKVKSLLNKLLAIKLDKVIARRAENHSKLRVSTTQYDRVVTFKTKAQKTIKLYVGNGKSGSVHLRLNGENLVYRVKNISTWQDLSTSVTRLIDTSYVALKEPQTLEISGPKDRKIKMSNLNNQWLVEGIDPSNIDQDRARRFVDAAKELIVTEVVSKGIKDSQGFGQGISVTLSQGKKHLSYRLGEGTNEHIFAKAEQNDFVVKVPSYKVKALFTQTLDDFLTEEAKQAKQDLANSATSTPSVVDNALNSINPAPEVMAPVPTSIPMVAPPTVITNSPDTATAAPIPAPAPSKSPVLTTPSVSPNVSAPDAKVVPSVIVPNTETSQP